VARDLGSTQLFQLYATADTQNKLKTNLRTIFTSNMTSFFHTFNPYAQETWSKMNGFEWW